MKRPGFTLLEIILATSLAAVVVWLLGMAITLHLRVADTSRYDVEQAQLARTLLQRIGDDLRNTAPFSPSQSSTGSSSSGGQSSSSPSSSSSSSSSISTTLDSSGAGSSDTTTGDDSDTSNVGLSTAGGICGDSQNLQTEICRMPRLDRTLAASSGGDGSMPMVPQSDARDVFYSVAGPGALGEVAEGSDQGGLVRREMDRSTFNFVVQQGQVSDIDQSIEVLAPEVEAIQFQYFDDSMEYDMWDSSQMGKLPTAVKVSLWLRRPEPKANSFSAPSADDAPPTQYSLMVFLPNSKAAPNQAIAAAAQQAKAAAKQPQEIKAQDSLFSQDKQAQASQTKDDKTKSSTGKPSATQAPTQLQLPNQSGAKQQQQPQQIQQSPSIGKGGK